jgi:hypothetical protein
MTKRDRKLRLALLASGIALAALLFGPAILEGVIKPAAVGIWMLIRVLVLSVDQIKIWTFLMLALIILFAFRAALALMDGPQEPRTEETAPDQNATLGDVEYWRYMFAETPRDDREYGLARREFAKLLLSAYASKERLVNDFTLYERFKSREIPLPEGVYDLVFSEERAASRTRIGTWLRRVSGRDRIDYRRELEHYLEFLKSYMEISDDE